jgi:hypothetical protein
MYNLHGQSLQDCPQALACLVLLPVDELECERKKELKAWEANGLKTKLTT